VSGVLELEGIAPAESMRPLLGAASPHLRRGRGPLIRRTLVAADLIGLAGAFLVAELLFGSNGRADAVHANVEPLVFLATLPLWIAGAKAYGLYSGDEQRADHITTDDLKGVLHGITLGTWLFFGATSLTGLAVPNLHKLATFWILAIAFVTATREIGRVFARRRPAYVQRALIVGSDDVGRLVAKKLARHPEYRIDLAGFVSAEPAYTLGAPVLGEPADLLDVVAEHRIDRVIFTTGDGPRDVLVQLVRELHEHDVQVDLVPPLYEVVGSTFGVHTVEGLPLLGLPPLRLTRASRALKRGVDIVLASLLLVILAPAFALVALWIKLDSSGPVFFRQVRVGLGDRHFLIYKFRTMVADAEALKCELVHLNRHYQNGDGRLFKIDDDPRVTRSGRLLRRYYLDEFPQLVNVLRGEMSLVGPRPLIPEEDAHVGEWSRNRLRLKPGMTGVWQVLGRSEVSFEDMIRFDYIYVTHWSLAGDFRLLVQTAGLIARGTGRSH
jgi:exopolysaccharide biosynthesis polyprenyl glycosylphosphotransferase